MAAQEQGELSGRVSSEVRAWMGRRGIRQQELADAMGVSRQAISARLAGRTQWTVDDLAAAANALDVEVTTLLAGPDGR